MSEFDALSNLDSAKPKLPALRRPKAPQAPRVDEVKSEFDALSDISEFEAQRAQRIAAEDQIRREESAGMSTFGKQFRAGVHGMIGTVHAARGALNRLTGDYVDEAAALRNAEERMAMAASYPRQTSLTGTEGTKSAFEDPITYFMETAGQAAPSLIESVGTGILSAAVATQITPGIDPTDVALAPTGFVAGLLGKQAVKKMLFNYLGKNLAKRVIEVGAKHGAKGLGVAAARKVIPAMSIAAVTGSHEAGGMYMDLKERGITAPGSSLAMGLVSGLSEGLMGATPSMMKLVGHLGKKGIADTFKRRGVKAAAGILWDAAKGAKEEGIQEGFQELLAMANMDINDPNHKWTKESFIRFVESAAAGAVVGGVTGGAGGIRTAIGGLRQDQAAAPTAIIAEEEAAIPPESAEGQPYVPPDTLSGLRQPPADIADAELDLGIQPIPPEPSSLQDLDDDSRNRVAAHTGKGKFHLLKTAKDMGLDIDPNLPRAQIARAIVDAENAAVSQQIQQEVAPEPVQEEILAPETQQEPEVQPEVRQPLALTEDEAIEQFGTPEERIQDAGKIAMNERRIDKTQRSFDRFAQTNEALNNPAFVAANQELLSAAENAIAQNNHALFKDALIPLKKEMRRWKRDQRRAMEVRRQSAQARQAQRRQRLRDVTPIQKPEVEQIQDEQDLQEIPPRQEQQQVGPVLQEEAQPVTDREPEGVSVVPEREAAPAEEADADLDARYISKDRLTEAEAAEVTGVEAIEGVEFGQFRGKRVMRSRRTGPVWRFQPSPGEFVAAKKAAPEKVETKKAPVEPTEAPAPAEAEAKPEEAQAQEVAPEEEVKAEPTTAAKEPAPQPKVEKKAEKIEDFGEVLQGARKHFAETFEAAKELDIRLVPLSKSFPAPNYQELVDKGVDPLAVGWARTLRESIGNKPRKRGVEYWAKTTESVRNVFEKLISGDVSPEKIAAEIGNTNVYGNLDYKTRGRAELYAELGHENSLAGYTMAQSHFNLYTDRKTGEVLENVNRWRISNDSRRGYASDIATAETKEEVISLFKTFLDEKKAADSTKGKKFKIGTLRRNGKHIIFKKIRRNEVILSPEFDSRVEAAKYLDENFDKINEEFEAYRTIHPVRKDINDPRVGEAYRDGDVTPELFTNAFGFRGVQFGNWVENDKRQADLNDSFDALMDLAAVLGVEPKALSLNSRIGLAFGARGKGGKGAPKAHFERGAGIINLTKKMGAGSLAHEWFHAADETFAIQDESNLTMLSDAKPWHTPRKIRPELLQAFKDVQAAIAGTELKKRSKELDAKRTKDYWSTDVEMSARVFEQYVIHMLNAQGFSNDFLANIVSDPEVFLGGEKEFPYLLQSEEKPVFQAFNNLFKEVKTRKTDKGVEMFRTAPTATRKTLTKLQERVLGNEFKRMLGSSAKLEFADALFAGGKVRLGQYVDALAKVARNQTLEEAELTTYHEAFHAGLDLFVTPKQKESILEQYNGDEEAAADAFMQYAKDRKSVVGKIRIAFGKILSAIKKAFVGEGKKDRAMAFYDKLYTGELATQPTTEVVPELAPAFRTRSILRNTMVQSLGQETKALFDKRIEQKQPRERARSLEELIEASFVNEDNGDHPFEGFSEKELRIIDPTSFDPNASTDAVDEAYEKAIGISNIRYRTLDINESSIKGTFPGAELSKGDKMWSVVLPGGSKFDIILAEDIPLDVESIMRDYKMTREQANSVKSAAGATASAGVALRLSDGNVLTLNDLSILIDESKYDDSTIKHEALHTAKELGFFDTAYGKSLWDALMLEYGSEEAIAKARGAWEGQYGLWANLVQWFHRMAANFGIEWNPDFAMNETFTSEFWAQGVKDFDPKEISYQVTVPDPANAPITSIRNDVANELRNLRGKDKLEGVEAETQEMWLDDAGTALHYDNSAGGRLIQEMLRNPRVLSDRETAILQVHYRREYNVYERLSDKLFVLQDKNAHPSEIATAQAEVDTQFAALSKIEEATKSAGREWGRAGVARQIALAKDFSFQGMERKARIANGGKQLSRTQRQEVKKMADEIARLESRIKEESDKIENRERDKAIRDNIEQDIKTEKPRKSVKKRTVLNKIGKILSSLGFSLRKPKDDIKFQISEVGDGKTEAQTVIKELYDDAVRMAKVYQEEGITDVASFISVFRSEFGEGAKNAEFTFKKAWTDTVVEAEAEKVDVNIDDIKAVTREARRIQKQLVKAGVVEQNLIIDAVHEILGAVIPGMNRNQAIDALSGYGQYSKPSKSEVDVAIRDLNARHLQLSKQLVLDEAIRKANEWKKQGMSDEQIATKLVDEGLQLKATGFVRGKQSDIVRHMIAKTNEMKKELPPLPSAKEGQLQSALDAAKRATRNRINDLQWEIDNKERIVKTTKALKADKELEQLRKQRDELVTEHKKIFKQGASEEQRVAAAERSLERSIAQVEDQLKTGDIAPKKLTKVTSPKIEALRSRLKALQAQRKVLRDVANPKLTPEEKARRNYEANILRRIADYEQRIADKDFAPQKRKDPRQLSAEELKLKHRLEDTKQKFFEKAGQYRLANLSPVGKLVDYARETAHLSRALMTSIDLSAVFRQGGITVYSHPKLAKEAAKAMTKALISKQEAFNSAEAIRNDKLGQFAETAGLNITADDGRITRQEEAFMGRWADKIPGVAGSGRAYVTFLNNMRFNLFKMMVENIGKDGRVTLDEAKIIAKYINVATGRADFKALNSAAANMNTVFFAPRYVASRFQYLAMPFYLPFMKTSTRVKKALALEYARTFAGASVFMGSLMALAYISGGEDDEPTLEFDPRSSDFMKIRIGETRIDAMAGLQQALVFSSRIATGKTKSVTSKELKELSGKRGPYATTRWDVAGRFLRTKLGPIPGATVTAMDDMTDVVGNKKTPTSLIGGLFFPLSVREVVDTISARGITKGTAISTMAIFGMGVGTYGDRTRYISASAEERKEMFEKDLKKAKKGDAPLAYADQLSPDMLRKYQAKIR
jgi:hypothetical protein